MADSSIDITAGSGTAIDTRTEATSGNHRQVVVLGDPSTNAGVAAVDATLGLKVDLGEQNDVQGGVSAGSNPSDSFTKPLMIGARSTLSVESITESVGTKVEYVTSDAYGCLITRPYTSLHEILSERVADTGGTSTAFTNFAAGGAGIHNYLTTIVVYNSSSTDGYVDIRDGTAGSVLMTIPAPQTGGATINLPVPLKSSANTALAYDVSGAISTVYISVVGFQAQG